MFLLGCLNKSLDDFMQFSRALRLLKALKSSWSLLLGFQDLNQAPMKLDAELDFSTFA